jgi:uncharacterized membrane protein
MQTSSSTVVIEKLIDLELISKIKADLARFKRNKAKAVQDISKAA